MYYDYANILIFFVFGICFVILNVGVFSAILRPTVPQEEKDTTYECGEPAVGSSWIRFDIRFYVVALVFLVFDVEVAFLYPWAGVFKQQLDKIRELTMLGQQAPSGVGLFLFIEMLVFVVILVVGFAYVWAKGDLAWIKSTDSQEPQRLGRSV